MYLFLLVLYLSFSFPPTCTILAPHPVTSVNWRWSVDYPTDVGVPHQPLFFFSRSFLKVLFSKMLFWRHFRCHLVLCADHWVGWFNWICFPKKKHGFYIVMPGFLSIKRERSKKKIINKEWRHLRRHCVQTSPTVSVKISKLLANVVMLL